MGWTLDVLVLRNATSTCNVDTKIRRYLKTNIVIHTITGRPVAFFLCNVYHLFLADVKICGEEVRICNAKDCDVNTYLLTKNIRLPIRLPFKVSYANTDYL